MSTVVAAIASARPGMWKGGSAARSSIVFRKATVVTCAATSATVHPADAVAAGSGTEATSSQNRPAVVRTDSRTASHCSPVTEAAMRLLHS